MMADDRNFLIKYHQGKWKTVKNVSTLFLQAIGAEINQRLENDLPGTLNNSYRALDPGPKQARILKYF